MPPRARVAGPAGATTAPGPASMARGRRGVVLGDEKFLWLLVAIELVVTAHLRARFRSAHGG
jgi:hypothetical protein